MYVCIHVNVRSDKTFCVGTKSSKLPGVVAQLCVFVLLVSKNLFRRVGSLREAWGRGEFFGGEF